MSEVLDKLVTNWLKWDKNEKDSAEIAELYDKKDMEALRARMCGKLAFGTAGVRARMEAGFGRLNDLTIIVLTNAFALHLKNFYKRKSNGVAIGFDGRHNSRRWADLASNVFVQNGIKVYKFSRPCTTPITSYATVNFGCDAGLMITASHNPKHDNGYKAYWTNGCQILAPHDDEICKIAYENMEPKEEYWDTSELRKDPLFNSADPIIDTYFAEEQVLCRNKALNEKCPIKFTYSAFHGVGTPYATRIFKNFGFQSTNIIHVHEQARPDPDFPTVPFPNPEEGLSVLTIPIATADKNNSTVLLVNDPDADRFQLAEKQSSGEWKIFTGNEMGALMTWWLWHGWREQNSGKDASDVYVVNSAVSSSIARTIAAKEGFKNEVSLTGFKWLGNKTDELRRDGKTVLLAWEESIGFMLGHVLDKDGITAAAVFADYASYLHSQNSNFAKQLFKVYNEYGFHVIRSTYWFVPNPSITKNIFEKMRKDKNYPKKIGKFDVKYVRDLTIGYDNEHPDNKPVLPLSTSSEMITYTLPSGSWVTIRASGTEPKIKYYIEWKTEPGKTEKDLDSVLKELTELEQAVVDNLLEPKVNGLTSRK